MNQDEIIRMAEKAGFPFNQYGLLQGDDYGEIDVTEMLVRFAALVAAAEREACAKVMDNMAKQDKHSNYYKVAAKAIRARGNA